MRCSLKLLGTTRIPTSLPDGKWREVAEAARVFEELGIDEAAAHEVRHDLFAALVPATLSTHKIALTTSVAIAFPRSPMIVAILAQDLNVNSNGRFVLGLGSQVKQHNERRFSTPWTPPAPRMGEIGATRDLALLGKGCAAQFQGRTLQLHADDFGILAAADWSTNGTDHNRRSRSGHAAACGSPLRWCSPSCVLHPRLR